MISELLAEEGMPEELPLLVDDPDYVYEADDEDDLPLHQVFLDGRGYSENTAVDVFMTGCNPDKVIADDIPLNTWS